MAVLHVVVLLLFGGRWFVLMANYKTSRYKL